MPEAETFETRGRLLIPGDTEAVRISDVVTADGPRGLIEILAPGEPERVLASAAFDRGQTTHIVNGLLLLLSNFLGSD